MPCVERVKCNRCQLLIKHHQPSIKCVLCTILYHRRCASNLNRHNKNSWNCHLCVNLLSTTPFRQVDNNALHNDIFNNPIANGISNPTSIDPSVLNDIFSSQSDQDETHTIDNIDFEFNNEAYVLSNDIDSYCSDIDVSAANYFNLLGLNVRSLKNTINFSKLESLMFSLSLKPSIIGVSETWITPTSSGAYNNLENYSFISNHRLTRSGGGVGFYILKSINFSVNSELSIMNEGIIETLFIEIVIANKRTYVGVI